MTTLEPRSSTRSTSAWMAVATALAGTAACADDGPGVTRASLPAAFKMTGAATLDLPDGGIVECTLDLIFELREEVGRTAKTVSYHGIHGGGMYRSVRAADDSGTTFWLNVYGEIDARLQVPDRLEIDIPINRDTGSRFYDNFNALVGTVTADGHGSGAWTCAPLDTDQDGHPDRMYSAEGTWQIEPVTIEPEPPEGDGGGFTQTAD